MKSRNVTAAGHVNLCSHNSTDNTDDKLLEGFQIDICLAGNNGYDPMH